MSKQHTSKRVKVNAKANAKAGLKTTGLGPGDCDSEASLNSSLEPSPDKTTTTPKMKKKVGV